ncbi:hypothetical protein ABT009_13890 [Streptomyces sp. NPDC002896]|uniref:hypothetical protein n=1 Tax=Streptomyces sp. NPDC002896 TaxID=3154438 RepID=UPI0033302477
MMSAQGGQFAGVVRDFEAAVHARDPEATGRAFMGMQQTFGAAAPHEIMEAGPRLAGVLAQVPPGPRSVVAVITGACVERGADPLNSAPGLFEGLRASLEDALEFCALWAESGGGDFPEPGDDYPPEAVVARTDVQLAEAWWGMPQWEMAALAHLNHRPVRQRIGDTRREALALLRRISAASGEPFKCLSYALRVLDDEPLVALHRESGTGYLLRMSGIGDNFQLHTLLADALVGRGYVQGYAPTPHEVAVCRDAPGQVPTTGSFNLVAPDGSWIWNEGDPSDIPVVDGVRLLVLDPSPYQRGWPAGRFFPSMPGDLVLERALSAEEAAGWFTRVSPMALRPV